MGASDNNLGAGECTEQLSSRRSLHDRSDFTLPPSSKNTYVKARATSPTGAFGLHVCWPDVFHRHQSAERQTHFGIVDGHTVHFRHGSTQSPSRSVTTGWGSPSHSCKRVVSRSPVVVRQGRRHSRLIGGIGPWRIVGSRTSSLQQSHVGHFIGT